jgi:hypothetical protein
LLAKLLDLSSGRRLRGESNPEIPLEFRVPADTFVSSLREDRIVGFMLAKLRPSITVSRTNIQPAPR